MEAFKMMSKCLLIMPPFFGYHKAIERQLQLFGYQVLWLNDRAADTTLFKAAHKLIPSITKVSVQGYFEQVLRTVSDVKPDVLLIITGMSYSFSPDQTMQLLEETSDAYRVLYLWDSLSNSRISEECISVFDSAFSFNPTDCDGDRLRFLPLFYVDQFAGRDEEERRSFDYFASYVGTVHQPEKYALVSAMHKELEQAGYNCYMHKYLPSKSSYCYRKLTSNRFQHAKMGEFHFDALSSEEIASITSRSKAIIDVPQANQIGLTIRTIETLGIGRKLITSNESIAAYDFYNPSNIYIYRGSFDFKDSFFHTDYEPPDEAIVSKYSVSSWLNTVLN